VEGPSCKVTHLSYLNATYIFLRVIENFTNIKFQGKTSHAKKKYNFLNAERQTHKQDEAKCRLSLFC